MQTPQTNDLENRLVWLDSLRLAAGVSMVGLHATSDATGQPFVDYTQAERVAPMLLRAVIYTARTELFLIISVFLLLMALRSSMVGMPSDAAAALPRRTNRCEQQSGGADGSQRSAGLRVAGLVAPQGASRQCASRHRSLSGDRARHAGGAGLTGPVQAQAPGGAPQTAGLL